MKKIVVPLIVVFIMAVGVLAWDATRSISGNDVTLTVDPSEGTGYFTITETVVGATISTPAPSECGIAGQKLTCDYDKSEKGTIIYKTTGTGTVSGTITGGYPSISKTISGDTKLGATTGPGCNAMHLDLCKTQNACTTAKLYWYDKPSGACYKGSCPTNTIDTNGDYVCEAKVTKDKETICNDKKDNDGDKLIDCADSDCATVANCVKTEPVACNGPTSKTINLYQKATTTLEGVSKTDECSGDTKVTKYYCLLENNQYSIGSISQNCKTGETCQDGACVKTVVPPATGDKEKFLNEMGGAYDQYEAEKSWTAKLISKIASIFQKYFP